MSFSTRWPFDDRRWAEEMFRAFSPFFSSQAARSAGVFPAVNIYDDGHHYLIRAEVPGMSRQDFEVSVKGDQVSLSGNRKIEAPDRQASFHRRECEGGQFSRTVTLPQPVDADKIAATYQDGVLEVLLPRVPEAQPRKIQIQ